GGEASGLSPRRPHPRRGAAPGRATRGRLAGRGLAMARRAVPPRGSPRRRGAAAAALACWCCLQLAFLPRGAAFLPRPAHLLRPPAAAPSAGLAGGLQGLLTLQQAALAQETAVEVRVMDAAAVERGNQILFSFVGVAAVLVALTAFVVTRGQDERGDLL
ncbi:unnamed protein product, partial [Prorocentrum cordatum]